MKPISDIDIFLKIFEQEEPLSIVQLWDLFSIPETEQHNFYLRIHALATNQYLASYKSLDGKRNLIVRYHLGGGAQNALVEYYAKQKHDELMLNKYTKNHRLSVIGAVSGLFGAVTGLIALLLQLFQNTSLPVP